VRTCVPSCAHPAVCSAGNAPLLEGLLSVSNLTPQVLRLKPDPAASRYGVAVDVNRAADLYAQGWTLRQIGAELGVHWTAMVEDLSAVDRRALTKMLVGKIITERDPSKIDKDGQRHYLIRAIPYQDPQQEAERLKAVHGSRSSPESERQDGRGGRKLLTGSPRFDTYASNWICRIS